MAAQEKETAKHYLWFAGVSIIAGIIYLKTICPTVEFIDSGELAVNCFRLGIPHPTGYPLYVLLGKLAVILFPGEIIFRCHFLSLIFTSLAAGLLFSVIKSLSPSTGYRHPVSASIALFIAFSPVWWSQGTANEVYCITLLADLLAISFFIKYINNKNPKFLIAGFFIWGLSFGSHMSTVFLLPALIYMVYITDGFKGVLKPRYRWAVMFFIVALTLYIYLPVRASFKPFLNWSNPANLEGLINHISGWQYRVWMFKSPAKMIEGVGYFFRLLYEQFGVVGLILTITGLISSFSKKLKLSVFLTIIILADIIYSSNYEIIDIESYYLLGFACMAIFAGLGLLYIINIVSNLKSFNPYEKIIKIAVILALFALPVSNLLDNYYQQDKSDKLFAAKGVENMLVSMDNNGLAIIENWDLYSPWLYYRYALNIRPDVVMIDKELLRRSWYLDFLRRYHPEVMNGSEKQITHFLELLKPFETGGRFNPQLLTASFQSMISSIISTNSAARPFYTNILKDPDVVPNMARNPVGVMYKLEDQFRHIDFDINKLDFKAWESSFVYIDKRTKTTLTSFYRAIIAKERFCRSLGREDEAVDYRELGGRLERILKQADK